MRNGPKCNWLLADVIDDGPSHVTTPRGVVTAQKDGVAPPPSSAAVAALHRNQNVEALCDATMGQLEELDRLAAPGAWQDAVRREYQRRWAEHDSVEKRRAAAIKAKKKASDRYRKKLKKRRAEYRKKYREKAKAK